MSELNATKMFTQGVRFLCQNAESIYIVRKYSHNSLKHRSYSCLTSKQFRSKISWIHTKIAVLGSHSLKVDTAPLFVKSDSPTNKYVWRTHTCGELSVKDIGKCVKLCGWIENRRLTMFLLLRDCYGITQVFIPKDRKDLHSLVEDISLESVVSVKGEVRERPHGNENLKMPTGRIEIHAETITLLNPAKKILPLSNKEYGRSKQALGMKYRYLALRHQNLQDNLRFRSNFISNVRNHLIKKCNFVDIETPTLFKNTPGGAQEFVVPTQFPGLFYSLVQSPQQLKQLLMIGGCDRYFQIARCYRDETSRFDRQPEFTQLDIEMSFVDCNGVMTLIEDILVDCWPKELDVIDSPFQRMTYSDAMKLYGTDKPDLRIPYQIKQITQLIDITAVEQAFKMVCNDLCEISVLVYPKAAEHLTNSVKRELTDIRHKYYSDTRLMCSKWPFNLEKGDKKELLVSELMKSSVQKELNMASQDVCFLAVGKKQDVEELLGKIRIKFADILEERGVALRSPGYKFLWVTDFPLFSINPDDNTLEIMHHPFTQPHPEDIEYLDTEPEKVRGLHYDLVLNGLEVGGGSLRIHNAELQRQILKMLNIPCDELYYMLEALECGAPPHGGVALGVDRLMSILCNEQSIRDVIAFPKTMEGRDLLSDAPSPISEEEKRLYHLHISGEKH